MNKEIRSWSLPGLIFSAKYLPVKSIDMFEWWHSFFVYWKSIKQCIHDLFGIFCCVGPKSKRKKDSTIVLTNWHTSMSPTQCVRVRTPLSHYIDVHRFYQIGSMLIYISMAIYYTHIYIGLNVTFLCKILCRYFFLSLLGGLWSFCVSSKFLHFMHRSLSFCHAHNMAWYSSTVKLPLFFSLSFCVSFILWKP